MAAHFRQTAVAEVAQPERVRPVITALAEVLAAAASADKATVFWAELAVPEEQLEQPVREAREPSGRLPGIMVALPGLEAEAGGQR